MVDLEYSLAVILYANLFLQSENSYSIGRTLHLPFLMLDSHISFSWCHMPGTDRHFEMGETHSSITLGENLLYLPELVAIQPEKLLWLLTTGAF